MIWLGWLLYIYLVVLVGLIVAKVAGDLSRQPRVNETWWWVVFWPVAITIDLYEVLKRR